MEKDKLFKIELGRHNEFKKTFLVLVKDEAVAWNHAEGISKKSKKPISVEELEFKDLRHLSSDDEDI